MRVHIMLGLFEPKRLTTMETDVVPDVRDHLRLEEGGQEYVVHSREFLHATQHAAGGRKLECTLWVLKYGE